MSRSPSFYTTPRTSAKVGDLTFERNPVGSWVCEVQGHNGRIYYTVSKAQGKWHVARHGALRRGARVLDLTHRAMAPVDLAEAIEVALKDHELGD